MTDHPVSSVTAFAVDVEALGSDAGEVDHPQEHKRNIRGATNKNRPVSRPLDQSSSLSELRFRRFKSTQRVPTDATIPSALAITSSISVPLSLHIAVRELQRVFVIPESSVWTVCLNLVQLAHSGSRKVV